MLELGQGTAPVTILSTAGTTFASAHMVQQIWYASTAGYSSWSLAIDSRSAARVEAILSSLGKAIPVTVIVKQVSRHLVAFCRYTVCSISTWTFLNVKSVCSEAAGAARRCVVDVSPLFSSLWKESNMATRSYYTSLDKLLG